MTRVYQSVTTKITGVIQESHKHHSIMDQSGNSSNKMMVPEFHGAHVGHPANINAEKDIQLFFFFFFLNMICVYKYIYTYLSIYVCIHIYIYIYKCKYTYRHTNKDVYPPTIKRCHEECPLDANFNVKKYIYFYGWIVQYAIFNYQLPNTMIYIYIYIHTLNYIYISIFTYKYI